MSRTPELPDVHAFGSLIDILDDAVARHGDAEALGLRRDDDTAEMWSFRQLRRRAWLAAWRLRHELGLGPGDRLLTWSPSTPELPAVYFGAMRAGVIFVPLDLRMSADAVTRIAERSGARALAVGTGRDAPDPREAGLTHLPARTFADLAAEPGDPATAEAWFTEVEGWPRPARPDVFEVIYTSGTTGTPKGRHAAPRRSPRRDRGRPPHHRPTGAPRRLAAPPEPPARADGGALLRPLGGGLDPLCPLSEPACHLRGDPLPPRHHHGRRAAGPRPLLERHRAGGRPARPAAPLRTPPPPRPTTPLPRPTAPLPELPPPVRRRP